MDSLPKNYRTAGTGGSEHYSPAGKDYSNRIFSNLISKIFNLKRQISIQDNSYEEILIEALDKKDKIDHYPGITPVNMQGNIKISSYFGERDIRLPYFRKCIPG
jgi:hypothetical protein